MSIVIRFSQVLKTNKNKVHFCVLTFTASLATILYYELPYVFVLSVNTKQYNI